MPLPPHELHGSAPATFMALAFRSGAITHATPEASLALPERLPVPGVSALINFFVSKLIRV